MTSFEDISSLANKPSYIQIIQLAAEFNVDVGFAYATWALETGYGSSTAWQVYNNPAGIIKIDGSGEYEMYASKEEGLRAMFELIQHYCNKGNCSVSEIREIWSETNDTDDIITIWKEIIEEEQYE